MESSLGVYVHGHVPAEAAGVRAPGPTWCSTVCANGALRRDRRWEPAERPARLGRLGCNLTEPIEAQQRCEHTCPFALGRRWRPLRSCLVPLASLLRAKHEARGTIEGSRRAEPPSDDRERLPRLAVGAGIVEQR